MAVLKLYGISKSYQEGANTVNALQQADLEVQAGELIAIIGPSGSGKSTLLSIAGALLKPSEGQVMINGINLATLTEKELAKFRLREIGFILQTSNLIPYLKIVDQLILVKKMSGKVSKDDRDFASRLLTDLGLADKLKKMPHELSGGERQRVAIARAFMNNSNLILADEPTASLDSKRAIEVVELLSQEAKKRGKAAVMVTHDERMLPLCDHVYRMEDGILTKQS
ncbi:ABC transporter ATP-binding protein [Kurthia sibirica]|uniref:Hemin ABC transporter ATP-binding protein n=1 Tax=Kurthia sibirica TaxID=202750 RepID=A0A2U3AGM8_9BACL|nr:ABC transporter ATP-binding protein [Kurthia sibirica]PWI23703.1 hemin ABC transporter ATP-binding protein [Kurthia sibirica]GEK35242.1 ABC transporter ATP-binding protein [Kurthia sibirica]